MSAPDEVADAVLALIAEVPDLDPLSDVNKSPLWHVYKVLGRKLGIPEIGAVGASDVMAEIHYQMTENNAFSSTSSYAVATGAEALRRQNIYLAMTDDEKRAMRDSIHDALIEADSTSFEDLAVRIEEAAIRYMDKPGIPFDEEYKNV